LHPSSWLLVKVKSSLLGWSAFGVTAAAMIATPLRQRGKRSTLATVVVGGLAVTTFVIAGRRWGWRRATIACAHTVVMTLGLERVGTKTGVPFGRYHYSNMLRPQVHAVPLIVPFAWFAMALPAREVANVLSKKWRIPLGSALLTAWDLFLDPQMVSEGYWQWARKGRYRGIPASNYLGWFVSGLGVMAALDISLPQKDSADNALVGEYAWMSVMQTLGFAAFFKDPLVAAVGGTAMLPPAMIALWKQWRQ
jgi:uncharacterized membrane protein